MATPKFNHYPVVMVHVDGFRDGVDVEILLTYDEARELAQYLLAAADQGGVRAGPNLEPRRVVADRMKVIA